MNKIDTLLVSITYSDDDENSGLLVVGRKYPNQHVDIVNAFQGKEARELYEKLVMKKPEVPNA